MTTSSITSPLTTPLTTLVLARAEAVVAGDGVVAHVLADHLRALGADVRLAALPATEPHDVAARVALTGTDGVRRDLYVDWAGPVDAPGVADEATVQALAGVMHVHGRRSGEPRALAVDYCSTAAAVLGVTGLLASLLTDRPDGEVRTSVMEAGLLAVSQYLAAAGADDPEAVDLSPGGPPFLSADDVRFEIESLDPSTWGRFWRELGVPTADLQAGWTPFQFRYATATAPLPVSLMAATRAVPFAELVRVAAATGVDICRLRTRAERVAELASRGDDGAPAAPWEIVPAAGRARSAIGTPSLPLQGLTLLEAGRRIQAPMAAHLIGLLGATVVRVEPPGGDPLRGMPPSCGPLSARWLALNRGKDAVEVDIKDPADRARLISLSAESDVFLHNWAPGKAEELGLGADDLAPGIVYAYTSGWAGSELDDLPMGTDFMVQARTGMAGFVRYAEEDPAPSLMTIVDVLGGLLGAEAVVAGLLARRITGAGVRVESSLLGAADTLQRPALHAPPATGSRRQPTGVTTDLADLLTDDRLSAVLGRDEHGCPALHTPWRMS